MILATACGSQPVVANCNESLQTTSGCEDQSWRSFSKVGICIDVETGLLEIEIRAGDQNYRLEIDAEFEARSPDLELYTFFSRI